MSDSHVIDVRVCDSLSPEPRLKRPTLQLALKQQAKRRRRNTSIATQGNVNPFPRVIVKVLPPLPPLTEESRQTEVESPEFGEEEPTQTVKNVNSVPAAQTTMQEVLASIPGFKTTKRQTRNLSAAAQIQKTREGCVDLQNPSSILVHANLRGILNKHSFSTLPVLYQHKLIQLLPEVDRCPDGSAKLNSTALSNEFFARSCQKWTERLAAGEFTPEFQQKMRAEAERDKGKLDPWKIKHFEPFWGGRGETSSLETSKLTTSTLRASCSSSAGAKRKAFASSPDYDEDVPKKSSVGRRVGRKRIKRKKPIKRMILPSVVEGEVKAHTDFQDLAVPTGIVAIELEDAGTSSLLARSVSPEKDVELTDSAESTCEDERISTQAEEEELESDAGIPSVSHETSDEPLTEVSGIEEIIMCSSHQLPDEVVTSIEQGDTSLDQHRSSSSGGSSLVDGGRSSVEQNSEYPIFISTVEEEEESEDGAFIDPVPVKDSLPPVSSSDEEQDNHFNDLKIKEEDEKDVVSAEKIIIETETTLNDTMEDLLGDDVGHFVQEDSSPEDFYQSEQVTEALELLRNIHDEDDAAAAKASNVAGTSVSLSQTISPPNLSCSIAPLDNAVSSQPKSNTRDNIEPNFPSTISRQTTVTINTGKASNELNSNLLNIKMEPPQGSSTSQVATTAQQQPPTTTTVTLTLPFPVTLPLNLPLTLPINLPPGTTLVVSDPAALMGIRPASSQSPCSTSENGKTSTSISTSFAAIAPSKLRSSTPSPSRILPRSSSHPPLTSSNSNTNSPPSFSSGSGAGSSTAVARSGGISKQSQQPSKAPPGTVNLERSYRICQAVIENSPNCEQLKAQLRPPSAFSSPNPSPSSGSSSSSSSSSSGCAVVISANTQPVNGIIPIGATIGQLSRQVSGNSKNSTKQGSSSVKSIKGSPLVKLTNEIGKTVQSTSLASASASSMMLLQSVTSGNCVHLDSSKATTVSLSAPAQLQLQQPRQKLLSIAPSKPDAPSKSHQPIAPAGSRAVGSVQRSGPQLQRSASAPVKPSTTITLSSISQTQPLPQQQQQTTTLHNWPRQPVQIKPLFSSASVSIGVGVRSQANNIQPHNHAQSNSVNPSSVQQEEQQGLQIKSSLRVVHPTTISVRPRAAVTPQVHQLDNQVLVINFSQACLSYFFIKIF